MATVSHRTRSFPVRHATWALCAALLVCALIAPSAALSRTIEEGGVQYTHESETVYKQQLESGQIQSATIHPLGHTVHLTLANGQHVFINVPSSHEAAVRAQLEGRSVHFTVASAPGHKLRYIIGGVVIVLIILVVAFVLWRRRRRLAEE